MKKLILSLAVVTALFVENAKAQETSVSGGDKGFYFKLGGGYNFSSGKSTLGPYQGVIPNNAIGGLNSYPGWNVDGDNVENINTNLGKGFSFGGTVGYMFNKHLGAELNIDYLIGSKAEAKYYDSPDWSTSNLYSKMLMKKPNFVVTAGYSAINPYGKLGLILGHGKVFQDIAIYDGDIYNIETEANGGIAFGFNAGLGVDFSLNSKLSIFCEANLNNLTYAPKEGKITKLTQNGVDITSSLSISEKEYEYEDEVNVNGSSNPNQPTKWMKTHFDFNTVGIKVGLKYSL